MARTVEQIEKELKEIKAKQLQLVADINKKQEELTTAETLQYEKSHVCCNDVCTLVNRLIDIDKTNLDEIKQNILLTERKLKEMNITSHKPLAVSEKNKELTLQRITSLNRLKEMLKNEKICNC